MEEEPQLPLEPAPAINWRGVLARARSLLTLPKLPGWLFIALLIVREIPDWRSRYDFWLAAVVSLGGVPAMMASFIASPLFTPCAALGAAAYIILVGEPKRGALRQPWWPYIGWSIFGAFFTMMVVVGIAGYVEIYIKQEVGKRDDAVQKQAAIRPVFWHLTDFQKTALAHELDTVPESDRFEIKLVCLSDAGSRTYANELLEILKAHNWKFAPNCLFNRLKPDVLGLYVGVSKSLQDKIVGKPPAEFPPNLRTLINILAAAQIPAQWAVYDEAENNITEDRLYLLVGNAP